jgi:hypothetical protein
MAITITVEDGSVVDNANSYVSLIDLQTYATDNGYTISSDDDVVSRAILLACDFLNGLDYIGSPAETYRAMAFPRTTIVELENIVPEQLIKAQCYLTCNALTSDIELFSTDSGTGNKGVKMEKVSVLQTEYFEGLREDYLSAQGNKKYPYIWNLLKPFFDNTVYSGNGIVNISF